MTPADLELLKILVDSEGYVACDGPDRRTAHRLDHMGYATWKGDSWGSSFWCATELGRSEVQRLSK